MRSARNVVAAARRTAASCSGGSADSRAASAGRARLYSEASLSADATSAIRDGMPLLSASSAFNPYRQCRRCRETSSLVTLAVARTLCRPARAFLYIGRGRRNAPESPTGRPGTAPRASVSGRRHSLRPVYPTGVDPAPVYLNNGGNAARGMCEFY